MWKRVAQHQVVCYTYSKIRSHGKQENLIKQNANYRTSGHGVICLSGPNILSQEITCFP